MNRQVQTVPPALQNIFHNKRPYISTWKRTVGYRTIQCVPSTRPTTVLPWISIRPRIHMKMTRLPTTARPYKFQLFSKWKGFEFYNAQSPTGKKKNPQQIANSLLTEEETNLKARSTALVSAPKIDLADGNRREQTYYLKTAANATPSPSPEPSVQIAEHSDVMDPISAKCCWTSKGFISDFLYLDPTMEGLQEPRKGLCHPNSYQNLQSVILLDVQKVELYWAVHHKHFHIKDKKTVMKKSRRTSIQFGYTLHTKLDTSTLQWRPFCFNTQTANWRRS